MMINERTVKRGERGIKMGEEAFLSDVHQEVIEMNNDISVD